MADAYVQATWLKAFAPNSFRFLAPGSTAVETAICLMKEALVLLDEADACFAAADLQQAIDTAAKTPIASSANDETKLIALFDTLTRKR